MKPKTRTKLDAALAKHPRLLELLANPNQPDGGLLFDNFSTQGNGEATNYTDQLDMQKNR